MDVDNRSVKTNLPNTVLGVIPLGKDQQNIPLRNISAATISTKYNIVRLLIGVVVAFIGLFSLLSSLAALGSSISEAFVIFLTGIIFAAVGVGIAGSGMETILEIQRSGNPYLISVPFYEKSKMQQLSNHINNALVYESEKEDLNLFFDRKKVD